MRTARGPATVSELAMEHQPTLAEPVKAALEAHQKVEQGGGPWGLERK
jgi:hypothetical protein